jgi:hypothetical protein
MHLKILRFSSGLKMSGAVEKLRFTYLWNRYHKQIPAVKLLQIGAISILLCQHWPLFHCWKDIWCWKLPCREATSENDRLLIYSLWSQGTGSLFESVETYWHRYCVKERYRKQCTSTSESLATHEFMIIIYRNFLFLEVSWCVLSVFNPYYHCIFTHPFFQCMVKSYLSFFSSSFEY